MYIIIASFLTAFTLTYFTIPSIIYISKVKHLFDEPGERSSHTVKTPSLGGIGIFAGAIFAIILWTPFQEFSNLQYILCSFIIIFLIGAKDDILPISPTKKLIGQVLAASILIFKSDIELSGFHGIFGLHDELPSVLYIIISLFTMLVIINSFNLIDGINGLAGSVGSLIAGVLGAWFLLIGRIELAVVAFTFTGAVMAFLRYNFTPAKIFMGDTGSLLVGLVASILIIQFIELNATLDDESIYKFQSAPAVAMGILIIPLFDTARVFTTRMLRGGSPFTPDRRHIHHLLIDYGFTHMQATSILVLVNVVIISLVVSIHPYVELHFFILLLLSIASILTLILQAALIRKNRQREQSNQKNNSID